MNSPYIEDLCNFLNLISLATHDLFVLSFLLSRLTNGFLSAKLAWIPKGSMRAQTKVIIWYESEEAVFFRVYHRSCKK